MSRPERWEPLVRPLVALCKRDCVLKNIFNTLVSYKSFWILLSQTSKRVAERRGSECGSRGGSSHGGAEGGECHEGGGGSGALGFMAGPRLLQGFSRALGRDGQGGEDIKEHPVARVPCSAGPDKGGGGGPRRRHQKSDNINGTLTSRASLRS